MHTAATNHAYPACSARLERARNPVAAEMEQPNQIDQRRLQRGLERRVRYRYVSPVVSCTDTGYLVTSPCCSRNIDPQGGVIDIALFEFDHEERLWTLFSKDHEQETWVERSRCSQLHQLISQLAEDPERVFWQ